MSTVSEEQVSDETTAESALETEAEMPSAAQFEDLGAGAVAVAAAAASEEVDLDVILDVPVTVALEVGRTSMTIRDLLRLNQGSVVELDRPADEPMDVLVNGTLVAHAEIVVVDEMFGIRLIDVVSPSERIRNLR